MSYTWSQSQTTITSSAKKICCSNSGQIVYLATQSYLYYSPNFGSTFIILNIPSGIVLNSVTCSLSGSYVSITGSSKIYISSNYGLTWVNYTPSSLNFVGICTNSTGQFYATIVNTGFIYLNNNYGSGSWTQTGKSSSWNWICCDLSGTNIYAVSSTINSNIYASNNGGNNWSNVGPNLSSGWDQICCSSNGQYVAAVAGSSQVYVSSNYGSSWTTYTLPFSSISCIGMNYSGQVLCIGQYVGSTSLWYNTNYGSGSWTQVTNYGTSYNWTTISINQSSSYIYAGCSNNPGIIPIGYNTNIPNIYAYNNGNTSVDIISNNIFQLTASTNQTNYNSYIGFYPGLAGSYFLKPFGVSGQTSYSYSYGSLTNYYLKDSSSNKVDISTLCCPIYNLYTSGTNVTATTSSLCTGIFAILIGGGGGGGGGSATTNGYGFGGGGGGGGGCGAVYIANPNPGTAMTYTYTIGTGGTGGNPSPSSSGNGSPGTIGTDTSFNCSGITYVAKAGGAGTGATTSAVGVGGAGGSTTGSFLFSYNGNAGSNSMAKANDTPTTTMGGLGGFSGNYNITSGPPPAAADTNPTPSIMYNPQLFPNSTSSSNPFVWDPSGSIPGTCRIINENVISGIYQTGLYQNGSGTVSTNYKSYTAPVIGPYPGYYGQGGFGGNSDTNSSGSTGWKGSPGQPGALYVFQYFGQKTPIPSITGTQGVDYSIIVKANYVLVSIYTSQYITFNSTASNCSLLLVGGGGSGNSNILAAQGGGGGAGGSVNFQTNVLINSGSGDYYVSIGSGGSAVNNGSVGNPGNQTSMTNNLFPSLFNYKALGGAGGNGATGATGSSTGGNGGTGGYTISGGTTIVNSTPGTNKFSINILGTTYYFSGGGSGGYAQNQTTSTNGGAGGGGGGGTGSGANNSLIFTFPDGKTISPPSINGFSNTGGGGAGANVSGGGSTLSGAGGSGLCLIWYPITS